MKEEVDVLGDEEDEDGEIFSVVVEVVALFDVVVAFFDVVVALFDVVVALFDDDCFDVVVVEEE